MKGDRSIEVTDAYIEYIERKRLAEDLTRADPSSFPNVSKRCPIFAERRYENELPLARWQWVVRIIGGLIMGIPSCGFFTFLACWRPEPTKGVRPPLEGGRWSENNPLNLGHVGPSVGGPLAVTVIIEGPDRSS